MTQIWSCMTEGRLIQEVAQAVSTAGLENSARPLEMITYFSCRTTRNLFTMAVNEEILCLLSDSTEILFLSTHYMHLIWCPE